MGSCCCCCRSQACGTGGCCGKIAGADIVLNELPSQLVIRDSWAQSLIQGAALFHVPEAVDLTGAYARGADTVSKARVRYPWTFGPQSVGPQSVEFQDHISFP